ncbi:MAG: fused DSP-PTPase phosphatase/NAD kinase-like protein [Bosea sp. (in: a-proteobacteria)]
MLNRWRKPEERYARRMARIARWDRPLQGWRDRAVAWASLLFIDHGIFRLAYLNAHKVSDQLWRAAQPAPGDIARFAKAGVKTIINLRGGREHGAWPLEREACERHGIALVDLVLRSREAPDKETLLSLPAFFASVQWPAMVHCKSGADRAGLFSALYVLIHEGRTLEEAMAQLSWRYGHYRYAKTGILDAFFEMYALEGKQADGSLKPFLDWVREDYDPARLAADFKPGMISDLVVDKILRRE